MTELPHPSDFELAILRVLWRLGPATVRQVFEALQAERELGYTTVLKTMQIMAEKGLVLRDESAKSHVYRPAEPESETKRGLVADMMTKAFAGSAAQLLVHALAPGTTPAEELDAIQRLLDEARGRRA